MRVHHHCSLYHSYIHINSYAFETLKSAWTLYWAFETHQVPSISRKRSHVFIIKSVRPATGLLWELKCTQDLIPAPGVKMEETFTEVVHGAPGVLVWELRWFLERTPMEGLKHALNLRIGPFLSMLSENRIDTHSSKSKNIQPDCHGRCILSSLIFYFKRHVTVGYFTWCE